MAREAVVLGDLLLEQGDLVCRSWQPRMGRSRVMLLELCSLGLRGVHPAAHQEAQEPAAREVSLQGLLLK